MTDNKVRHAVGGLVLLIGLITYGYSDQALYTTVSWVLMALGAYLITQALFAILFTVFTFCLVFYFTGQATNSSTLILMIATGSASAYVLVSRFRSRIEETREARWQERQSESDDD